MLSSHRHGVRRLPVCSIIYSPSAFPLIAHFNLSWQYRAQVMTSRRLVETASSEQDTDEYRAAEKMKESSPVSSAVRKNTGPSSKKRKRGGKQKGDWRQEQEKYYQRLLHTAQKDLRKQAKIVRTFECQKMVRKIKEKKADSSDSKNIPPLEATYEQIKQFDLDIAVQESLRRLGILHLDPKVDPKRQAEMDSNSQDDDDIDEQKNDPTSENENNEHSLEGTASVSEDADYSGDKNKTIGPGEQQALLERILKHKKLQTALENWNEQVTEYRRWSLKQEEKALGIPDFDNSAGTGGKKKRKKRGNSQQDASTSSTYQPNPDKSLFVCLGGGGEDDNGHQNDFDEEMPHYGPGSFAEKKKNRPGQRARKAKAVAIEAKQAGRTHRAADSLNWRPKKQQQPSEDDDNNNLHSTAKHSQGKAAPRIQADTHKPDANTEELHPSWAAKKESKKEGIVQFQGTKITF